MNREVKIFIASHLNALYIILDLQFNLGDYAFNAIPPLLVILLLYLIISDNRKLNEIEKRSIWFLIVFKMFIGLYYEICIMANKTKIGREWVNAHNYYTAYFIIFSFLFYTFALLRKDEYT